MHVISRKKLRNAAERPSDIASSLDAWYRLAKKAAWRSLADARQLFPSADSADRFTVFNIKGNSYRLIAEINYRYGRLYVRYVLAHGEYDKGAWKT